MKTKKFLALVPARKGSKGVFFKNVRVVEGKPLIQYTIDAAIDSGVFDSVYVSSDDPAIEKICKGQPVEFILRPKEISSDNSTANDVIKHFLELIPEDVDILNTYIFYLQPTSPLREKSHIIAASKILLESKLHGLISLTKNEIEIFKCFRVDNDGKVQSLFEESMTNASRQSLPPTYRPNGAIYAFSIKKFLDSGRIPSNGSVPFIMTDDESLDIDAEEDFQKLDYLLKNGKAFK